MDEKLSKEQLLAIVAALDEAIEQGPWSASNFLSLIGKKLQMLRTDVLNALDIAHEAETGAIQAKKNENRFAVMQKIYIALYAFDGTNLQNWERILEHVADQMVSRPIYAKEEDAIENLHSKVNRLNDAYAEIYIDPLKILNLPPEKTSVDKLGKPLLALMDNAILRENIVAFVHQTGRYLYEGRRLFKVI